MTGPSSPEAPLPPRGGKGRRLRRAALLAAGVLLAVAAYAFSLAELQAPEPTLLLLDRHGRFLAESSEAPDSGYGFWPVAALPPRVVEATLALEDRRFWSHPGVDPLAVVRAAWQNLCSGGRVSGASTIAMQVARMQHPGPRSYGRKMVESLTALLLTSRYGREEVLRHYLRLVPYGNNIHGIAYAARRYLDKPVADLSWAEIAFLAAIPQAPGETNPFQTNGRRRAVRRGRRILTALGVRGVIDAPTLALARTQLDQLRIPSEQPRPQNALHAILKLEITLREDRRWARAGGEPLVRTSLDLELQDDLAEMGGRLMETWRDAGAEQLAAIVLKRDSQEVLAWLGSEGYYASGAGAIDYTQVLRSPGSSLKPFVYAQALERGSITPGTVLYDLPAFGDGFANIDRRYLGPLLPRQALANSRNVPAIRLVETVGQDEIFRFLGELGIHDDTRSADYYGLGMAIGTLPTSLERLVRAYGTLANDGELRDLVWVKGGTSRTSTRVLSASIARLVTLFLSDPLARLPSFPRMGTTEYPFPVAVKTGTSQDYRDAWAVAFSRDYLVGVWVGRPDVLPMRKLGGAGSAAELARKLLLRLHGKEQRAGLADLRFPAPDGYRPYTVCAYTGERSTGRCEPTLTEWFPGTRPPEEDRRYLRLWVDRRTGNIAGPATPRRELSPRTFLKIPSFLGEWADSRRIPTVPMDFAEERALAATAGPVDSSPPQGLIRKGERVVTLTLLSPGRDLHLYRNPELPMELNTLALQVTVEPAVGQVLWYVDGKPYRLAAPPYTVRWPMEAGRHTFQARLPYRDETSATIAVAVD